MTRLLRTFRVASVLTAFRLAIVVPVGLGVLLWNEPLGGLQLLGLGLALVAVLLMSRHAGHQTNVSRWVATGLLLLVFSIQGMSTSCLRWVHYAGLDDAYLQVLMVIGFTAGTIGATFVLWEARQPIRRFDLAVGAGIGGVQSAGLNGRADRAQARAGHGVFPIGRLRRGHFGQCDGTAVVERAD